MKIKLWVNKIYFIVRNKCADKRLIFADKIRLSVRQGRGYFPGQRDKMKSTRTSLALIFSFLLVVQLVVPEEKRPSKPRFSLKVTGGWGSRVPIGDVNDCLASFNNNEVFEFHRKYETGLVVGEIRPLDDRISHWEAELRFDLTSRISIGIATSAPFHAHNDGSVTYSLLGYAGPQVMTWTFRPEIKVSYPIRLSAYYTLPIIHRLSVSIGGGFGFYSARVSQFLRFDEIHPAGDLYWSNRDQEGKRNFALDFHGNMALEYFLTHRLALVVEYQQRHIKIGSLKGTWKWINNWSDSFEKKGTLYYFTEWDFFIGTRHASLEIFEEPPEYSIRSIEDLREAVLDLSGHSLRIGIRIMLF
jgi:hypothetical protein